MKNCEVYQQCCIRRSIFPLIQLCHITKPWRREEDSLLVVATLTLFYNNVFCFVQSCLLITKVPSSRTRLHDPLFCRGQPLYYMTTQVPYVLMLCATTSSLPRSLMFCCVQPCIWSAMSTINVEHKTGFIHYQTLKTYNPYYLLLIMTYICSFYHFHFLSLLNSPLVFCT